MCSGPILKKLLKLTLPIMLSGVLQLLFNAADIIVVGNFASDNSLAAVGSTTALINLLTNLFLGLSTSANVLTSRFMGAGENEKVSRTVHTSIFLSIVCGFILTVLGIIFADKLLILMQTPPEVLDREESNRKNCSKIRSNFSGGMVCPRFFMVTTMEDWNFSKET